MRFAFRTGLTMQKAEWVDLSLAWWHPSPWLRTRARMISRTDGPDAAAGGRGREVSETRVEQTPRRHETDRTLYTRVEGPHGALIPPLPYL